MIGNQTKGKSFRGLLDYLENKEESSLIGGNMFGTNARELAREFRLSRQLNPEAEKVVHHVSLSLSPGEQLDNDTWCEIADKYIEEMGYTANQYAIYRHNDRNHDHIHICASRISLDDGKITRDSWEYVRSEKIIRQLELEYGLQQTLSSKEKLNRAPSSGQQRRIEREQLEYEHGLRNTPPQQSIKTQLIELIDRAIVDKPTMPQLVERLQLQGVEVRHGLTRNGKSKGISYSWNDQKFSGTSLGPAYTFPGLQKHKFIDYQPQRDDGHIEHLLKNPRERIVVSQQLETSRQDSALTASPVRELERGSSQSFEAITAIVRYLELQEIEQSLTKSSLSETLPQLTEQLSGYWQQLEARRTAFDDLLAAIADVEQLRSQRTVDAIADFIEQSVVESTLSETLPQLTEQLSQYRQQLEARRTAFDGLDAAITQELQSYLEKRAILSISDYIEQSAVESALTETVLELTQQLSQYQQELVTAKTTFNDLDAVLANELQSYLEKRAILSISDYIEQSAVESALTETVLELTQQLSQYQQELVTAKTTFNDLDAVLANELQSYLEKRAISSISDYIEQSAVESALTQTVLELTQQLSQYQQELVTAKTTFNDLDAVLANELQSYLEKRAISSISDYIEQSAVESALTQSVLELTQQLSQYKEQLVTAKTTFNDLDAELATELQSYLEKRAISSISDYVEQSTVSSALTETVLELTQQLSQNQQQLSAGRTIFDDLEAAIVYLEQLHRSQKPVDAIPLNQTPTITTDEPKLKDNLSAELYQYYSADLQNLLVTDRDKEIAIRALLDNKPVQDVEEIIFASPAGWTIDEAKALVLIANNQLAHLQEQPQFTPPPEDESKRQVLQYYLMRQRGITNFLVQPLQRQGLAYIDQQENVVFIKRDLNGENSGALVWDTARLDNRAFKYPDSDRQKGWFHLKLGGEADDKIERVFLCDSPIDALSLAEIDRKGHLGQPPVRTMYMAVDDPDNLPVELLRNINRIGLAFNNDSQGNETSLVVQEKLPQAKRIAPSGLTWNEILVRERQQQQEMLSQKQRGRGLSR
ncbi:relaxase/mobilization nuclease domain-containing protein [Nostoc sp.]